MKKLSMLALLCALSISLCFSQKTDNQEEEKSSITIGFLQGRGALIGIDFEQLISERIGLSAGFGIVAYGASIHYHLKPSIKSSSVALNYWHQVLGDSYVQGVVGPTFVFRFKKLSFQLGLGAIVDEGPLFQEAYATNDLEEPDMILLYSLGVSF